MSDIKTTTSTNLPLTISGIDTMYYFYESNENYDDFFLDILDQLDSAKGRFEKRFIEYSNNDLKISINNQLFEYNGKAQGFYWFTQLDNFLTIGFKDNMSNRGLNDIQVQFNSVGIYTLGIKALLRYVNDLVKDVTTGYKPLTRVDLNIFVQADLSWIKKDMFVSRKRQYASIFKEIASKHRLQTLYIGKKPFLLRMYDKKEELKNSKKRELMYEHFLNNGFNSEDDIFNIEFEMHRGYLKTFNIDSVDDLLQRGEQLFKNCLDSIRLVDLNSVTDNTKNQKNKNRALTHELWTHLHNSYKLNEFLALDMPLERIKRKNYTYTIEDATKEHLILARKFYIHGGVIDKMFYDEMLQKFQESISSHYEDMPLPVGVKIRVPNDNANSVDVNISKLNDIELEKYVLELERDMTEPDLDLQVLINRHQIALIEQKKRGIKHAELPI